MSGPSKQVNIRYVGNKDVEADQWRGTGTVWRFSGDEQAMAEAHGLALVAMLPDEFALVETVLDEPPVEIEGEVKPIKTKKVD